MIINLIDFPVTWTDIYFENGMCIYMCVYIYIYIYICTHIYISINKFYWSIVVLLCHVGFCCTSEWISYMFSFFSLPYCIGVNFWYKFSRSGDSGYTSLIADLRGINFLLFFIYLFLGSLILPYCLSFF